jgi:hypothetical protein
MWYLLKVDALIAVFVFAGAGLFMLALLAWQQATAYAATGYRIYKRLATLITQPQFFASSLAISRSFSRSYGRNQAASHKIQ